jgi:predicted butyrate kinase (DUF1464 family)
MDFPLDLGVGVDSLVEEGNDTLQMVRLLSEGLIRKVVAISPLVIVIFCRLSGRKLAISLCIFDMENQVGCEFKGVL